MATVEYIKQHKLICICRKLYGEELLKLAKALYDGGIRLMEVTFDQADPDGTQKTAAAISDLVAAFGDTMHFGAGTVLTCAEVDEAARAGAKYIISPNTNVAVIEHTKKSGLLSVPGAMTPTEVVTAHEAGADFVKVFPAGFLGVSYFKDLSGPLNHINTIAAGGVTEENITHFLDVGVTGFGISGRLTEKRLIDTGNYAELTKRARAFSDKIATY